MIENDTIQILRKIVAEMGRNFVCLNPNNFAGAILDICDADDVKLLTNTLRAHYSYKLMDFFRSGSDNAVTWAQQKAFLIEESGMSSENVEIVLDTLWQAMDWHPPKSEHEKQPNLKPDSKNKKEYIDTSKTGASGETVSPQVDQKYKKEYVGQVRSDASSSHKADAAGKTTSGHEDDAVPMSQPPIQTNSDNVWETGNNRKQSTGADDIDRNIKSVKPESETERSKTQKPQAADQQKKLYAYEKAGILCFAVIMVLGLFINKEHDPTFMLDYVLNAIMIIPFFMSFGVAKENLRTVSHGGAMLLTILIGGLILFCGIDLNGKFTLINKIQAGDNNVERLAWQRHLATQDIIFIITTVPLFIQMVRHRILERKRISA